MLGLGVGIWDTTILQYRVFDHIWLNARNNEEITVAVNRIRAVSSAPGAYGISHLLENLQVGMRYTVTLPVYVGTSGQIWARVDTVQPLTSFTYEKVVTAQDSPTVEIEFTASDETMFVGIVSVAGAAGQYMEAGLSGATIELVDHGMDIDVFVDSVNGNDSNYGTYPDMALASIGAVTITDGLRIGVARGSYFREEINEPTINNVTIEAYGEGAMPVFDCADVMEGVWTQPDSENLPNVWMQTVNHTVDITNFLSLWKNGERMFWMSNTSSLNNPSPVTGAAGYYHVAHVASSSSDFYIYSEVDPNETDDVYEASTRDHGIRTGQFWTVRGIRTKRNGHHNGSLIIGNGTVAEDCIIEDGVRHNAFGSGSSTFRRCIAWKMDWPNRDPGTAFVGYMLDGSGNTITFEECSVLIDDAQADWAIAQNNYLLTGILIHTNGQPGEEFDKAVITQCTVRGANVGIEVRDCLEFEDTRNRVLGARFGIINWTPSWNSIDPWVAEEKERTILRGIAALSGTGNINGARVYARRGSNHGLVYMPNSLDWSLSNSIIFRDGTDSVGWCQLVCSVNNGSNGDVTNCILHTIGGSGGSTEVFGAGTVENNVYHNMAIQLYGSGAIHYPEWIQYVTGETIRDRNSVNAPPLVIDPANGDFNLDPDSPAIPIGAGLLRPDAVYTPLPDPTELATM